jgi:hypothetical protein
MIVAASSPPIVRVSSAVDLKSPTTLALGWLLGPLLVVLACAGLGAGLARLSRLPLGVLTLPAGFLAGIALMTFALEVHVGGIATAAIGGALAIAGLVFTARSSIQSIRLLGWKLLWPAAAWVTAYAAGIAPLAGSGRSSIAGYVLNNDPSVHLSAIELLRDHGAWAVNSALSSYNAVETLFAGSYPLGSYPWVLFASVLGGIEPFHIWTPMIAVASGMTALVSFWILREIRAPTPFAAAGGAVIACGYLPYSYLAQGGAKEVITALSIYGTIALFLLAVRLNFSWRGLLPAAVAASAAINNLGLGALAWLGPASVLAAAALLISPPGRRSRLETALILTSGAVIASIVALPSVISSIDYVNASEAQLINPAQVGNLLGAVPWSEAFNIWFAHDYRVNVPEHQALTAIGVLLAGLLAVVGVVNGLRRGHMAVTLAVATAVVGAIVISVRYSIYFDAKAYMALAPALGIATAAGILWLYGRSHWERIASIVLGAVLAGAVIVSDYEAYAGAWITPKERFQEMINIDDRFSGQGPILVNEREEYSKYLLRDVLPWESWGSWQPDRGLRFETVPPVPLTPDFDYYTAAHMARFNLLLDRKRPGGSHPPGNFRVVYETAHYRVWRRVTTPPQMHVALGLRGVRGTAPLNCHDAEVRTLFARAKGENKSVRVAYGGAQPIVSNPGTWQLFAHWRPDAVPNFVDWRPGFAIVEERFRPGRYHAYIQGSVAAGLRLYVDSRRVGETHNDLGLQDGWQPLGATVVKRSRPSILLMGLKKPRWQSGKWRPDVTGPLAFVRDVPRPRIDQVTAARATKLCGKALDWIELP